jgi:hypothetical protein
MSHNISMIIILILEETHGAYNYFRTDKCFAHIQRIKTNVTCQKRLCEGPSELYEKRRLSLRVAASKYGMAHTALYYRIEKISNGDECNLCNVLTSPHKSTSFQQI